MDRLQMDKIRRSPVEGQVVYPHFLKVSYIPVGFSPKNMHLNFASWNPEVSFGQKKIKICGKKNQKTNECPLENRWLVQILFPIEIVPVFLENEFVPFFGGEKRKHHGKYNNGQ